MYIFFLFQQLCDARRFVKKKEMRFKPLHVCVCSDKVHVRRTCLRTASNAK